MKFKNRTQEHIIRSGGAIVLAILLMLYRDDKLLLSYFLGSGVQLQIIQIVILVLICWLAFGKLKTPAAKMTTEN